ncbi:hypothetical protein AQUCO_02600275v1 [Aquilegia coerulea]|uniref:Major facilitator superfamily (MFS) profile domain-containing protein n=1 Tax=Aquilegia coerulea TaxID=218851 RepID=A0A2G5D877_AQUCA|nr:hypothetical protein AQUCO_02600275v1 [Aquilegia coerulea]
MEEKQVEKVVEKKKGGARTLPFIFSNEICERLAVVGFAVNMMSYLTLELHLPLTKSANILTNFAGTSILTTFAGAFIADAYAGRYWTIIWASFIYLLAMTSLTLSASLPGLRPPSCKGNEVCKEANEAQLSLLYVSLLLSGIAGGGLRCCVVPFGADQFDESDPKNKAKSWNFFNWYYIVMGLSILISVTVIVYIQENVGWGWGLGIPTVIWFFSIVLFIAGSKRYRILSPTGSPFTRLFQVMVAAVKKRRLPKVSDPTLLYQDDELDASIIANGKLLHTKQLKVLDKAAMMIEEDKLPSGQLNLWRVSTVHRVEELKSILRMGPIWASGLLLTAASANQGTFTIQQARSMDPHLSSSFQIPPASMSVFTIVTMIITVVFYDRVFIPVARHFTGVDRGISYLHRMTIGFVISTISTLVSGFVEVKRKNVAAAYGLIDSPNATIPISIFWLVPQYALYGIAEGFMSVGHLEYFFDQSPESMRSSATAFYWTAIAAGNYLSSFMVTIIHKYTAGSDDSNWLPDYNINKGKLENFFWMITGLQVINLIYYMMCVKYYTFKAVQIQYKKGEPEGGKELVDSV